jgi:ABC-type sugar transport system ATPase subunit
MLELSSISFAVAGSDVGYETSTAESKNEKRGFWQRLFWQGERANKQLVLSNVSFKVERGECVALLGKSGAGKSTLLRVVAGLTKPDTGEVQIDRRNVTDLPPSHRGIGFLYQGGGWYSHLTVEQHFRIGISQPEGRADALIDRLGLGKIRRQLPSELSAGELHRVALGRVLMRGNRILLLDEPFENLDRSLRIQLSSLLLELRHEMDLTLLVVTHNVQEIAELVHRCAILDGGRVVQVGTPKEVYENPCHLSVVEAIGSSRKQILMSDLIAKAVGYDSEACACVVERLDWKVSVGAVPQVDHADQQSIVSFNVLHEGSYFQDGDNLDVFQVLDPNEVKSMGKLIGPKVHAILTNQDRETIRQADVQGKSLWLTIPTNRMIFFDPTGQRVTSIAK